MAIKRSRIFDDLFTESDLRGANYTQWSERAIIVGYNGDTQTYDIVISTERLAGVSKRTLNKTIRNVKSTVPGELATFSPGDLVLVGYINDAREHPIIIGGGGTVVQEPAIVTIGSGTSEVEGGGLELEGGPGSPGFIELNCTGFLVDTLTGSTTTVTLDCDDLDANGCFQANIEAPVNCGCGVYEWSMSGGLAGVTNGEGAAISQVATLNTSGPGDFVLKICPPTNNTGVSGDAWKVISARSDARNGDSCPPPDNVCECTATRTIGECTAGCDDIFSNVVPGNCVVGGSPANGPGCGPDVPCASVAVVCHGNSTLKLACCDGITGNATPCGPFKCQDFGAGGGGPSDICIAAKETGIGTFCDLRTESMINQGCAPCRLLMRDQIVTSTDACGRMLSLEVNVELVT